MNRTRDLHQELESELAEAPIVSTHEHHRLLEAGETVDLAYLFENSYVSWCGGTFGDDEASRAAFLDKVGVNSYFRWLQRALQELYGFDEPITAQNWQTLSDRVSWGHQGREWFFEILRDRAHIERAVLDTYWSPGSHNGYPEFYAPTLRINMFLFGYARDARDHNGNSPFEFLASQAIEAKTFDDYLEGIDLTIRRYKAHGAVALKSALAYDRDLAFGGPDLAKAARVFAKRDDAVTPKQARQFGNAMFWHIAGLAGQHDLPFQNHVGLGLLPGSDPMHLVPVIEAHPQTTFVLFHGGYPWTSQVGALCHNYDNVYLDLVWLPLISTAAAVRALDEWIEVARTSDRIAWGGDCWTAEETYGAALAARWVVSRVLARKVADGYLDLAVARRLANRILRDNAKALYGL